MRKSLGKRILLFAGMFGLPAFFILLFLTGKTTYHRIPYFGEHKIVSKSDNGKTVNDTIFYRVPSYHFDKITGGEITEKDFEGKYILINLLDAGCPYQCNLDFKSYKYFIYDEIKVNQGFENVRLVSEFVPETTDTIKEFLDFIEFHKIDTTIWYFVKPDLKQIFNVKLDNSSGNPTLKKDSINNYPNQAYSLTLLLDKGRHIRGKYATYYTDEVSRITKEISLLYREERKDKK